MGSERHTLGLMNTNSWTVPPSQYFILDFVRLLGFILMLLDFTSIFWIFCSFFDRLEDIKSSDYVPTEQDVLRCRVMTTSISETRFTAPYSGQNVNFKASISGYGTQQ